MDSHSPITLVESHHAAAYGWAVTCCRGNRTLAEDVLQASYLKVLSRSARFDEESSFRTWLFGVIRNTAREHRRRAVMDELRLDRIFRRRVDASSAEESTGVEVELRHLVRSTLNAVSSRQREVLHLVFYERMTVDEAAVVMGVAAGTARRHYERGKHAMRRRLAKQLALEPELEPDGQAIRRRLAAALL